MSVSVLVEFPTEELVFCGGFLTSSKLARNLVEDISDCCFEKSFDEGEVSGEFVPLLMTVCCCTSVVDPLVSLF